MVLEKEMLALIRAIECNLENDLDCINLDSESSQEEGEVNEEKKLTVIQKSLDCSYAETMKNLGKGLLSIDLELMTCGIGFETDFSPLQVTEE